MRKRKEGIKTRTIRISNSDSKYDGIFHCNETPLRIVLPCESHIFILSKHLGELSMTLSKGTYDIWDDYQPKGYEFKCLKFKD